MQKIRKITFLKKIINISAISLDKELLLFALKAKISGFFFKLQVDGPFPKWPAKPRKYFKKDNCAMYFPVIF